MEEFMKLNISLRDLKKKTESKKIRREGGIPAIIYAQGKAGDAIVVQETEFMALMRQVLPGRLPTTIFTLADSKNKERRVVIKEIQYHPTTYKVLHLDLEELHDNVKVNVKVPIECIGTADCPGVKLGGVLRQVIRYLRVRCLPKDIPTMFELDIRSLGPRESRRLADLAIPNTIRPLADLHEVAAVIVKR